MITFKNLSESDHPHFAQELFEEAFPEQERPPFSSLRHRDAGKFHFLVAENGDEPVGILTYWSFEDLVYVEHFAIDEELRVVSEFKFFHDLHPFCPAPVRGYCAQYIRKARLSQVSKR